MEELHTHSNVNMKLNLSSSEQNTEKTSTTQESQPIHTEEVQIDLQPTKGKEHFTSKSTTTYNTHSMDSTGISAIKYGRNGRPHKRQIRLDLEKSMIYWKVSNNLFMYNLLFIVGLW